MSNVRAKVLAGTIALAALVVATSAATPEIKFDWRGIDKSVRPGDDFYRFANGSWIKATTIPAGQPKYDTSAMLREKNSQRVRELIQGAANAAGNPANRQLEQKISDYYASQMDAAGIEAKGIAPLSGELAAIAALTDRTALSAYLGRTLYLDDGTNTQTEGIFGVWIHQGFDEAEHYVPHLVQGGIGLPDPGAYPDPAPEQAELRNTYRSHIGAVLKLAGFADPDARAARVLALESAIAQAHASRADTDDVFKANNHWRRADFEAKAPGMNWAAYFTTAGLNQQADFVVWQPSAVIGTAALVAGQSMDSWKDYLAFHLIEHYAAVLPKAFGTEHNEQQAIAATTAVLGQAIGKLYVERYFPPQAKAAAAAMVENIRSAFRARIAKLDWMSPATKEQTLAKLAALKVGMGYPDSWIDYAPLSIVRGDVFGNLRRAEAFTYQLELAKLYQPVDPNEWVVLPQTVSAFIFFSPNTLQFSAGLLQPPYFDFAGDAASNYGSAGAGLAHEVSHSFDELGNLYDAQGRIGYWWTAEDLARYRAAATLLAVQLDAECLQAALCVHGKQVLGESVADLAGLEIAHDAYLLSLNGRPDVVSNGMSGEQRFFLAFAQRWRRLQPDAMVRQQVMTDTHLPGEFRSDAVRNVDAWYQAYFVKPGDKLYLAPKDRVRVW